VDRVHEHGRVYPGRSTERRRPIALPPIADYAFLSDCHTGALVAAGRGDRLALHPVLRLPEHLRQLARPAGRFFRFAPFGINHPRRARYEPGTNVLVTTWKTPDGWVVVATR
jgi:hypothetical protein